MSFESQPCRYSHHSHHQSSLLTFQKLFLSTCTTQVKLHAAAERCQEMMANREGQYKNLSPEISSNSFHKMSLKALLFDTFYIFLHLVAVFLGIMTRLRSLLCHDEERMWHQGPLTFPFQQGADWLPVKTSSLSIPRCQLARRWLAGWPKSE